MTIRVGPRPKLRVTLRSSTPGSPHAVQIATGLDTVGSDDEEYASKTELDDRFGFDAFKRDTADDELDFTRLSVALTRDDVAGEKDAFEVKDREVVIVKFFRGMEGHRIIQGANTVANSADCQSHARIVVDASRSA